MKEILTCNGRTLELMREVDVVDTDQWYCIDQLRYNIGLI